MVRDSFALHREPVWRDRSNFIINAKLPEEGHYEQLWTSQVEANRFRLCCIPFFLYDVALGDLVDTSAHEGREYVLRNVVESSGRYVFRAFFKRQQYRFRDETVAGAEALGAVYEWSSPGLVALMSRILQSRSVSGLSYRAKRASRSWSSRPGRRELDAGATASGLPMPTGPNGAGSRQASTMRLAVWFARPCGLACPARPCRCAGARESDHER